MYKQMLEENLFPVSNRVWWILQIADISTTDQPMWTIRYIIPGKKTKPGNHGFFVFDAY